MLSETHISLGSNLGDRRSNIVQSLQMLSGIGEELSVSGIYETAPQGFSTQPSFYNAVCRFWTNLDPFELLHKLKGIENALGRTRAFIDAPRTIDLDILTYGQLVLDCMVLTIPHPKMTLRSFVIIPLAELTPGLEHPVIKKSSAQLAKRFVFPDYPMRKDKLALTL